MDQYTLQKIVIDTAVKTRRITPAEGHKLWEFIRGFGGDLIESQRIADKLGTHPPSTPATLGLNFKNQLDGFC